MNKASGVLEIPYFQMEDAGAYECVAENSRGRNSVKGKLSFYGELRSKKRKKPDFSQTVLCHAILIFELEKKGGGEVKVICAVIHGRLNSKRRKWRIMKKKKSHLCVNQLLPPPPYNPDVSASYKGQCVFM